MCWITPPGAADGGSVDSVDIIDSVDSVGAGDGDEDCSRSPQNFKVIGHYSSGS